MVLTRRMALTLPLGLAACGESLPPRVYPPLSYSFLTPLRLNVATIDYAPLPDPAPFDAVSPVPAAPALRQMAEDRLSVGGSSGRALVVVDEARITKNGSALDGTMAMHVDIISAAGQRAAFAEARVARRSTNIGRDVRSALYDITREMLDDMNVELEFQLRRSLRDYLQTTTTAPVPAPVQQQDLVAPAS